MTKRAENPNLFVLFTDPLGHLGITYMVTGSVAGIVYGEPRLTHDVDLVLALGRSEVPALCQAFPDDEFYCPPPEVIETERRRESRGHFNLIHHETGFKADIYLRCDRLHRWGLARRQNIKMGDTSLWVAPPEYVILRKLEYYREGHSEKHLRDIAAMLAVSGEEIDEKWITRQVAISHLEEQWRLAQLQLDEL